MESRFHISQQGHYFADTAIFYARISRKSDRRSSEWLFFDQFEGVNPKQLRAKLQQKLQQKTKERASKKEH